MIIEPSIDKLLDRIGSHYSLAVVAAKRAHEIELGGPLLEEDYISEKPLGRALEEIAKGDVGIDQHSIMSEKDAETADENLKKKE